MMARSNGWAKSLENCAIDTAPHAESAHIPCCVRRLAGHAACHGRVGDGGAVISDWKRDSPLRMDRHLPARIWRNVAMLIALSLTVSACANRPEIASVQNFYTEGVPHTDRRGRLLQDYDPARSFLPLAIYHALAGDHHGKHYDPAVLSAAGFNAAHLWERQSPEEFAARAGAAGLQVIVHWPKAHSVKALSDDPALLAWYLDEEPSFLYPAGEIEKRFAKFRRDREAIRRIDPATPILVLDGPPTKTNRVRWDRWNRAGDITSHFNYPVTVERLRDYGPVERVAETTAIARRLVGQGRPVWMTLQAFGGPARGWRHPSPKTLRAMAYAAITHGATGLIYFAYDSFVTRDDGILGISPSPERDYRVAADYNGDGKPPLVVSDDDLQWSRTLFRAVTDLNAEMDQLREAILSPTSAIDYSVQSVDSSTRSGIVRSLLKESDSGYTVITVNVDPDPVTVNFQFPHRIAAVTPLFGSAEPVRVGPQGWTGRYAGEAVGVYRITFAP